MQFHPFPARLCANYSNINIHGLATVMHKDNAVEFTGDFIPLIPINQPAKVDWVYGKRCLASFCGSVYLSSSGLVRLVGVDAALVESARATFAANTSLPCQIWAGQQGFAGALQPAQILYLSRETITLHCKSPIGPKQGLYLNAEVDFLTLWQMPLLVCHQIPLRLGEELILCKVAPRQNDENLIALSAYSAKLEKL